MGLVCRPTTNLNSCLGGLREQPIPQIKDRLHDLAKSVFQVHAVGQDGKIVLRRQVRRAQMLEFFAKLGPCLIGMEGLCRGTLLGAGAGQVGP